MPDLVFSDKKVFFSDYANIGRSSRCTLSIKDIKLSRIHCEIILCENEFIVIDLHSQNGTYLNDKPITESSIKNGDILSIGKNRILFSCDITPLPQYQPMQIKKISSKDI